MLFGNQLRTISLSLPWNIFLLTVSGVLSAFFMCSIGKPHEFVSGGLYGFSMLIVYANPEFWGIGVWYALLNIPVLFLGWFFLSRRFMLYTIYCIAVTSLATECIPWRAIGIEDQMLAAIATGIGLGTSSGIALRSLGSDGGLNIISLILHNKYNINVGSFGLVFNAILFLVATSVISVDSVLYSMVITFLTSSVMNYSMSVFDKRKMVLVVSLMYDEIFQDILQKMGRGCTLLHAQGAYTGAERVVLLTVVHDMQLKRLEEIIYAIDPDAFVIIENTHRVLGKGFSQRKVY